jgi:hypothetical protein
MKRVNFHLTEKQISDLKKLSKETGLNISEIIRRALDAFFNFSAEKSPSVREGMRCGFQVTLDDLKRYIESQNEKDI